MVSVTCPLMVSVTCHVEYQAESVPFSSVHHKIREEKIFTLNSSISSQLDNMKYKKPNENNKKENKNLRGNAKA
jgi:hypothetical protein